MSDENVEQTTEKSETVETQESTTEVKPPETTQEGQAESTASTETKQEEEPRYKLKIEGEEVEKPLSEVLDDAQKGIHYQRKLQGLSEWETANKQKIEMFDRLAANKKVFNMILAASQGFDPSVLVTELQPPPPEWKEAMPELYYQQKAQYDFHMQQKALVENANNLYVQNATQTNTRAAMERARAKFELNDAEMGDITGFLQRLSPSGLGYTDQDVEYAVQAVVGKDRTKKEVLKTTKKINETIKEAAKSTAKAVNQKSEIVSAEVAGAKRFKELVKEFGR